MLLIVYVLETATNQPSTVRIADCSVNHCLGLRCRDIVSLSWRRTKAIRERPIDLFLERFIRQLVSGNAKREGVCLAA
jgi:hypothetical protein